ncbi:MAG: transporter substrate-binding domain-containing protein, partial [Deltaproteobacteria bacterium]|nr:transporter substrate-binding domain-containing protein [Deltaproteobacteria bacterium]
MRRVFPGLFLILVLGWIAGWAAPAGGAQPARLPYLEVPGLTAAEAAGIENLRRTRTSLILGVPPGPDCFLREDGSLAGSAVLVAGWLSDFFGIPVEISVLDSDRIFRALESREIDLTASLILQERRQNSYYMTGPLS